MKRERYFQDELWRMFVTYAILPAALFTFICGVLFMTVLLHGRERANREYLSYVNGRVNQMVESCEQGIETLAELPQAVSGPGYVLERNRIFQSFYGISGQVGYEPEMYLVDQGGRLLLSNKEKLPSYLNKRQDVEWGIYADMDARPGQTAFRLMNGWDNGASTAVFGRWVSSEDGNGRYIILAVPGSGLLRTLARSGEQVAVTDRYGWAYFCNKTLFLTDSNQVRPALKESGAYMRLDQKIYFTSKNSLENGYFSIYVMSDVQNVLTSLIFAGILVAVALLIMTAWVLFQSRQVTERKTEDLYKLLDGMELARQGNLEHTGTIDRDNEFKMIADAYNETITSLKEQMENNRKMTELLALAQTKQLESQFNPHFLYNTLENIRYMCRLEPETAERMVFSLSKLLRYSLDGSREQVTLKEDLGHLNNYLSILEKRFGSRFEYKINVEQECMQCLIPRLVLQPMIENSVKYGFGNQLNLHVELKAYIHEEKMMMICRDDGVGMSATMVENLRALMDRKEAPGKHSGLYNIHRRIQLLYGHPYGVEIRSLEGHGTTLVVTLPAVHDTGQGENNDASCNDSGR